MLRERSRGNAGTEMLEPNGWLAGWLVPGALGARMVNLARLSAG
jgi:hypothetical protein